jgi:septin family protein
MTITQTTTDKQYEFFQKRRQTLLSLIQRQLVVLQALTMKGWEETLCRLNKRVETDSFKVLVLGEFKRGKSTFINALLGDEVLPAYAKPCTAIINEVKWGDSKRALLHYSKAEDGSVKQPKEIPVEQIESYVVIKDNLDEIKANPYEKVELFWNLPLCQNGVEIIDSPGLNEHEIRQKVTKESIKYEQAKVSLFERILAAAGGFFVADIASGAIGAIFGFQEMLKSLIPQIAIAVVTLGIAGLNPFILIPAMALGGIIQGAWKMHSTNDKIKEAVTKEFINQLRTSSYQQANELSDAVVKQMEKIRQAVDQELGKEIQSIRDQVNSILAEKQKGQVNVEQKLGELASLRNHLDAIDNDLDELITQVAIR